MTYIGVSMRHLEMIRHFKDFVGKLIATISVQAFNYSRRP